MSNDEIKEPFFRRIFKQLPILFPMVALFHVVLLVMAFWSFHEVLADPNIYWTIVGLFFYTILWFAICDLKKWAGIGYILLTALCIAVQFIFYKKGIWHDVAAYYFPINAVLSFFVFFYYKRLE